MQSSDQSDARSESRGNLQFCFAVGTLSLITVVSVLVGLGAAQTGNFVALRYALLFALLMILAIAHAAVVRYRRIELSTAVRTVERDGVSGTEIRGAEWQFRVLVALMVCGTVFCGMAAIDIVIHQDDGFPGAAVLFGALGLVFAALLAAVALGRISRGHITLSPQGIAQRGWSFESRFDWPAVVSVTPALIGRSALPVILVGGRSETEWVRRYTTLLRMDRLPKIPMVQIDCRWFDVDPYHLFHYIRAYVDNPQLRVELGTDAALARAQQPHLAG